MKKFINLIKEIPFDLKILFKSPKHWFYKYFLCILPNLIWKYRDIEINEKWYKILFPNKYSVLYVLMETFLWELFKDIKWLNKVIDIWWFIGESSIYLSIYNKEVYTYELSLTNYEYLEKNCKQIKNIHYFNWCISNSSNEYIEFLDTWSVSSTNKKQQTNWQSIMVKNYNILNLLEENNFDWLKIDIEGWEYDILKPIIDAWLFNFQKWIIEFHDLNQQNNKKYVENFLRFLKTNWYKFKIYDNEKNTVEFWKSIVCNIYFEKS